MTKKLNGWFSWEALQSHYRIYKFEDHRDYTFGIYTKPDSEYAIITEVTSEPCTSGWTDKLDIGPVVAWIGAKMADQSKLDRAIDRTEKEYFDKFGVEIDIWKYAVLSGKFYEKETPNFLNKTNWDEFVKQLLGAPKVS